MFSFAFAIPELTFATLFGEGGTWVRVRPLADDPTQYRVSRSNCGLKRDLVVTAPTPAHINDAREFVAGSLVRTQVRPQDLLVKTGIEFIPFDEYCLGRFFTQAENELGLDVLARLVTRQVQGRLARIRLA